MKLCADPKRALGFSLVELLVAMVIGLITVVVIGQVMAVAEGQKRSTTSGSDATVNSSLALFTVERAIKSAGYGLTASLGGLGCVIHAKHGSSAETTFELTPVSIEDGANGGPDSIRILSSSKSGVALPVTITVDHPKTAANFFVDSDVGIEVGDLMIAVPQSPSAANWCSLFQVTGTGGNGGAGGGGNSGNGGNGGNGGGQGQNQVLHNSGQSDWNQPGGQTIFPNSGYEAGDYLINLGQMLDETYSITQQQALHLRQANTAAATFNEFDLYPQIVQMQAVYGKDTNNDCSVDAWNATKPTTSGEWQQIRAVRVVVVARSQTREKEAVTLSEAQVPAAQRCNTANPHPGLVCWRPNSGDVTTGVEIALNINNASPEWQRYRYRVSETTAPVRNLVWLQKVGNPACAL